LLLERYEPGIEEEKRAGERDDERGRNRVDEPDDARCPTYAARAVR
jgi:hypothetical protein